MAKKILKEAVVRRFQKLANMSPINEMYANEGYMNEEEAEVAEAPADEMPADEMGAEDDAMGEEQDLELTQDELQAIADALPALQTLASAAAGGDMDDMDDMPDMDAEEGMDDMPAADEGGEEDVADAIMEALSGISYEPSQSEIVNEVAKRVAKRLKAAKLHEAKLNKALGRRK
jgi:DNA polymerase III delta prime subunit